VHRERSRIGAKVAFAAVVETGLDRAHEILIVGMDEHR
jgi:hypothetical protein